MGKIIQFPVARAQQRRRSLATAAFPAFSELDLLEKTQLKLYAACTGGAALLTVALQLLAAS